MVCDVQGDPCEKDSSCNRYCDLYLVNRDDGSVYSNLGVQLTQAGDWTSKAGYDCMRFAACTGLTIAAAFMHQQAG